MKLAGGALYRRLVVVESALIRKSGQVELLRSQNKGFLRWILIARMPILLAEMGYNYVVKKLSGTIWQTRRRHEGNQWQSISASARGSSKRTHCRLFSCWYLLDKTVKSISKDGFNNWEWSFSAEETEYGCSLEYEGSIVIISKKTPNPNIPNPHKKRRFATKAPARMHNMRTKIIGLFSDDAECSVL